MYGFCTRASSFSILIPCQHAATACWMLKRQKNQLGTFSSVGYSTVNHSLPNRLPQNFLLFRCMDPAQNFMVLLHPLHSCSHVAIVLLDSNRRRIIALSKSRQLKAILKKSARSLPLRPISYDTTSHLTQLQTRLDPGGGYSSLFTSNCRDSRT